VSCVSIRELRVILDREKKVGQGLTTAKGFLEGSRRATCVCVFGAFLTRFRFLGSNIPGLGSKVDQESDLLKVEWPKSQQKPLNAALYCSTHKVPVTFLC
jgi:hypothetical protein